MNIINITTYILAFFSLLIGVIGIIESVGRLWLGKLQDSKNEDTKMKLISSISLIVLSMIIITGCGNKAKSMAAGSSVATAGFGHNPCLTAVCAAGHGPNTTATYTRSHNTVVHFYGDSIHYGLGFASYDYPSFLNRIDLTTNNILAVESIDAEVRRTESQDTNNIWHDLDQGNIIPGDMVLFENAGPHYNNTDAYQKWLELALFGATHKDGVQVLGNDRMIFTTMFDFNPTIPLSTYSTIVDNGKSINDVVTSVVTANGTSMMDWNKQMRDADALLRPFGVIVVADTIHPTAWGNIVLSMSLSKLLGATLNNVDVIVAEILKEQPKMVSLGLNPSGITEVQIRQYLNLIKGVL